MSLKEVLMKYKSKYEGQTQKNPDLIGPENDTQDSIKRLLIFNSKEFEFATMKKPALLLLADISIDDNPRR